MLSPTKLAWPPLADQPGLPARHGGWLPKPDQTSLGSLEPRQAGSPVLPAGLVSLPGQLALLPEARQNQPGRFPSLFQFEPVTYQIGSCTCFDIGNVEITIWTYFLLG